MSDFFLQLSVLCCPIVGMVDSLKLSILGKIFSSQYFIIFFLFFAENKI